jgi:hypothetical protein
MMTTLQIHLPDALAREAARAGLLTPERIEDMVRERLRADRVCAMQAARSRLMADPLPPMSPEEIRAEIEGHRAESQRAAGP